MITGNKIHLCWCAIILLFGYEGSLAFPQSYRTGHSWKSIHLKQNRRLGGFLNRRAVLSNTSEGSNEWSDCNDERGLKKFLRKEFITIALPALIQLTAEPLASLVDTAYLGRLGPEVLGGAGVAISAQYTVSKLYNDPLLRTSISLVATEDGKARSSGNDSYSTNESSKNNDMSMAVSSALLLALCIGSIQAVIYYGFASGIIGAMGVSSTGESSLMYQPAVSYLKIRALGTPAATLWLVTNGIYRGMGDTITPLVYSLFFTVTNAILDPFFIFTLNFGASGAAAGTAIAQYLAVIPLMLKLNEKVKIDIIGQLSELKGTLQKYLKAGAFVFTRTLGKVLAYAVCAKEAALLGPVAAAAYNLTFQLGVAITQICESVAVAVQTLLARELADRSRPTNLRKIALGYLIKQSIFAGGLVASVLSSLTFFQRTSVVSSLTTNASVQNAALAIFPAILATQVLKGFAYPVNGIIMGGLDWKFTMICMWIANFACVGTLKLGGTVTLYKIWWALAAFMGVQVVAGILRLQSRTGVWAELADESS